MVYPVHYLLSYGGSFISDPVEEWSNNIRFADGFTPGGVADSEYTSAEYSTILTDFVTKIGAFMANPASGYSTNTHLGYVKYNRIGPDGRYASQDESHTRLIIGTGTKGGTASPYPLSTAMAVTFLTPKERGRASRGRVFVPHPAVPISSTTYRITPGAADATMLAWRGFISSLATSSTVGSQKQEEEPCVVSGLGTGSVQRINRVQIGDVLDYMGSRRKSLVETRMTSSIFAASA